MSSPMPLVRAPPAIAAPRSLVGDAGALVRHEEAIVEKQLLRRTPTDTPALHAVGSYAQGYRAGNFVFLQGQTGLTLDGEIVAPNDPAGQTRQALENIRALMRLAGGDLD